MGYWGQYIKSLCNEIISAIGNMNVKVGWSWMVWIKDNVSDRL